MGRRVNRPVSGGRAGTAKEPVSRGRGRKKQNIHRKPSKKKKGGRKTGKKALTTCAHLCQKGDKNQAGTPHSHPFLGVVFVGCGGGGNAQSRSQRTVHE